MGEQKMIIDESYRIDFNIENTPKVARAATSGLTSYISGRTISKLKGKLKLNEAALQSKDLELKASRFQIQSQKLDLNNAKLEKIKQELVNKIELDKYSNIIDNKTTVRHEIQDQTVRTKKVKQQKQLDEPSKIYENMRYDQSKSQTEMDPILPFGVKGSALEPKPGTRMSKKQQAKTEPELSAVEKEAKTNQMGASGVVRSMPDTEQTKLNSVMRMKKEQEMLQKLKNNFEEQNKRNELKKNNKKLK
jgi:hypothetical protein